MSLPTDVVDHILTFLQSDPFTLRTCAQSHPILAKLAKRHLYANVFLADDLSETLMSTCFRASEFAQILASTPDTANHVRRLTIICVDGRLGSQQRNENSSHLDAVASLLPMLTRLTRLKIIGFSSANNGCCSWHAMPDTFRKAFLHSLVHSRIMKDIVITRIAFFPMSLLNNRRNVRVALHSCKKTLYDKRLANTEDEERSYPLPFEHLCITNCSETCLENIAPWVKVHGLHSLELNQDLINSLQRLLAACSNSLKNLCLSPRGYNTSYQLSNDSEMHLTANIVPYPFTLAGLCHLSELTISTHSRLQASSEDERWDLSSPVPAISVLISNAPPTLQKLTVEIVFNFISDVDRLPDPVIIWFPFISLADKCSSASISMYISPSFMPTGFVSNIFSPFTDYKGLTPYVERGVVIVGVARHSKIPSPKND